MNWNDFNDAEQQTSFDLIPKGTLAKVRMTLKPGGHDDASKGWTDGYATESFDTGSIYLAAEFVVLEGEYAKRKLWSNIGLHSAKGDAWANMGRTLIRALLNSAHGVQPADQSPEAQKARRIASFAAIDGIEFVARIDVEKDAKGENRNIVKQAIEPDHKDYARLMGMTPKIGNPSQGGHSGSAAQPAPQRPAATGKPAWAQ
ncbi:hypothetical protein OYT1_ch1245 [Ferriphaselus amnicola]|uniref:Uncharacterized protein n=1 Tax=Ferriphaselus amnicola TaxID=1188319 RepID=A0A2Z6GBP0_9PROT|nr:hypothetical protein [Ferriphaselus amnicola]BBE50802.1 hypothetical protein OYT1_ch1245 [Ferriphaselus amnicola]